MLSAYQPAIIRKSGRRETICINDQKIFMEKLLVTRFAPFVVEAEIEPSNFRPVVERFTSVAILPTQRTHKYCRAMLPLSSFPCVITS
jgi:hypothetical protein